jgi:FkbM family methyltransferase
MSFVSYAQNFEDVMLWRALKHIEKGFYIDVGAQDPVVDSVSKAFYEHGWRGIHIEPVPQYAELLRKDRPDETVLQVALADTEGTLELNVILDTGLSTAVDAYAQRHQEKRGFEHERICVPVSTLKSALNSLLGKDVHWLKIDVEGFEEKVLKGWDSQSLRPWVIVVEATIPDSPETDYASWEPILIVADYQFVYFDGLNRFYVAKEHAELAEAFSCPPNVFDSVQLSGLASSELCRGLIESHHTSEKELLARAENAVAELNATNERTAQLKARAVWLENEWTASKQRVEELCQSAGRIEAELMAERQKSERLATALAVADQLDRELQSVYSSKSWRITWPLRKTMQVIKWVLALPMGTVQWTLHLPKRVAKPLVVWAMRKTLSNPRLKSCALNMLGKHPQLKLHLRQFAIRSGLLTGWSPRAARIYADLKRACEASKS